MGTMLLGVLCCLPCSAEHAKQWAEDFTQRNRQEVNSSTPCLIRADVLNLLELSRRLTCCVGQAANAGRPEVP